MDNNYIKNQDCIEGLKKIEENSIDTCITDPPYNYEFIGKNWDFNEIERRLKRVENSNTLVKNIPYGSGLSGGVKNANWYKKNYNNIIEYQEWCKKWGKEVFRVLKPGSFALIFNSTRTIARVQTAMEDIGFYTKDILVWKRHSGIPKGLNLARKLEKQGDPNYKNWEGWHSCLRNEWESIVLLQKPLENNNMNNVKLFDIGLLKTDLDKNTFQSNILEDFTNRKKENYNIHCTIKPLPLIERLIKMTTPIKSNKVVLDPFMGSGTTALASLNLKINYIGFELVKQYCDIAEQRIKERDLSLFDL